MLNNEQHRIRQRMSKYIFSSSKKICYKIDEQSKHDNNVLWGSQYMQKEIYQNNTMFHRRGNESMLF